MQKIILNAEFSFETAHSLIKYFADTGFSFSAKQNGNRWKIAAYRRIATKLNIETGQAENPYSNYLQQLDKQLRNGITSADALKKAKN